MRGLPDLTSMAFFIRIVEEGSISAAGRALGLSKAGISRRLATLEKRIGAPLIVRSTRAISLTDTGRALPGLGAEAFFRVELAFLGPAETCRLILTRRDPNTACAFGARQLRRGIWEARIRRNLRPGLSLGRRRVRRIGCKCHSRHRYCVQQCRLERLDHRRLSHQAEDLSRRTK